MNSVDRVKAICKERRIPISRLEKDLGFGNGYIGQLKKGALPDDRLYKIADYLGLDPSYILYGETKNPAAISDGTDSSLEASISEKDKRLLEWFRSLPQEKQEAILIAQDAPADII